MAKVATASVSDIQNLADVPILGDLVDPSLGTESGAAGPIKTLQTVTDYISGKQVKATAEEIEAVQVFARKLVDDLGYPKDHIQTRPQYRVRSAPQVARQKVIPLTLRFLVRSKNSNPRLV
jgi:hypothetical protein